MKHTKKGGSLSSKKWWAFSTPENLALHSSGKA
jgi:hypothetical protein